jgi:predicted nucleic acid-binding protein
VVIIDTNVALRFLTGDDPAQAARARDLVAAGPVLLLTTVILETAWVLRTVYRLPKAEIVAKLRDLAGVTNVALEDPDRVARALLFMEGGMEYADAMHLAALGEGESFATFDSDLRRLARRSGEQRVFEV